MKEDKEYTHVVAVAVAVAVAFAVAVAVAVAVVVAVAVAAAPPPAAVVSFAVLFVLLLSWVTNFWRRDDDCGDAAFDARSVQSHARPL